MKWKTVVIGMETQVPFHNPKIWKAFLECIKQIKPYKVIGIGDHLDCPAPSRWNRGTAAEYAGTLQKEIDTMKGMFDGLRSVYDGPVAIHEGNHERRINTYARTKAPAFADLECLSLPSLLAYDKYDITDLPAVANLCRGWVTTHDLGGLSSASLSKISGATALGYGRKLGKSVICGHTHRLGHVQETIMGRTIHGVESGHMMGAPTYCVNPNWQPGWVVFDYTDNGLSQATLVNVSKSGKVFCG